MISETEIPTDDILSRRMIYLTHRRRWKVGYDKPFVRVKLDDIFGREHFVANLSDCHNDQTLPKEVIDRDCRRWAMRVDHPW
jgi:hypothetical protein